MDVFHFFRSYSVCCSLESVFLFLRVTNMCRCTTSWLLPLEYILFSAEITDIIVIKIYIYHSVEPYIERHCTTAQEINDFFPRRNDTLDRRISRPVRDYCLVVRRPMPGYDFRGRICFCDESNCNGSYQVTFKMATTGVLLAILLVLGSYSVWS